MKTKAYLKAILITVSLILIILVVAVMVINMYIKSESKNSILTIGQAKQLEDVDCILVLGCGIRDDGTPSHMLEDRVLQSVDLFEKKASNRILMSGDHGKIGYNEVGAMKGLAINKGVPSNAIFMDHAGFSTYESMYRAKQIFKAKKVIIVTQEYHLYRAIYNARKLGIEAYGVASNQREYAGQEIRDLREVAARGKDFVYTIIKPKPKYLGEAVPVSGDGDITNG